MQVLRFNSAQEVDEFALNWLESCHRDGILNIFLPAGSTPMGLYSLMEKEQASWMRELNYYQMDDIVDGPKAGDFFKFFQKYLTTFMKQLHSIDSPGPKKEFASILGLGQNGHVAFHEPELPDDFTFGEVELNEKTRKQLDLTLPTKGLSYGVGQFLKSEKILLMVKGEGKREVFNNVLANPANFPAGKLFGHSNLVIITDLKEKN